MSTHQDPVGSSRRVEDEGSEFDRVDQETEFGDESRDGDPEVNADDVAGRVPAETNPADAADQSREVPPLAEDDDEDLRPQAVWGRGAMMRPGPTLR